MNVVEEYWQGVAQRLQVEADVFNRLIQHGPEQGRENEISLAGVIERLLPPAVGVGSGIIFDSDGNRSNQTDLILFDRATQPQLLAQTSQLLYPVETVLMAVEVKTTVNEDAVKDVGAKTGALAKVGAGSGLRVPQALFGYQCSGAPSSRGQDILALSEASRPALVCIMQPGIFGDLEHSNDLGFVPLHVRDSDGDRVSMSWVAPESSSSEIKVVFGTATYPIFRTEAYGTKKLLGEPGRALLLFCNSILRVVSTKTDLKADWLANYLPGPASELELIPPRSPSDGA